MANKNGIIINVGFDSDIKDYVNRIERQLKAVDWNGVLGLSESFNKEYEKITKQLQVLKKEISDLGAPDIHNMNNRLQSITQLTNRLTQQFDALVTSLPTDMQAKMNKSLTSVGNMLTDISEISNQASTAINGFTKAVVNSGVQVKTASSRVAEIQKLLGAIKELNENHKAFDTGEYFNDKSMGDRAKMLDRLYDIYEAYENANKRFSSNKRDLGAVKELQEQFYRFKELYDQILDLDIGDQDSSLTQFWTNVSLLGDKSGAALSDVLAAMKRNYVTIMNTVKKYKANLMAESATFKSDVATAVQTETKEIKKGSNGETIRLVIGVDDSILNKELLDAIAKAQAFAEKNPVHVSVDISTKYRIRKDKETLALLQAEMDSIKEEIENAQYNGASDKAVTALQNKLENAAKTFDKYFKGLDTAYSFHISLHTEYAMKQLSMFISQVKEQINKLKQDKLVFAPEVEIDEAFETHLKESTEKVLGKMQDAITKTADALDRLKVYFTEGIEMKPDFMKEERVALGLLWQDLKKVYDQVVLVSEVFKSLAGEKITINNDMQTETLESLKGAMNSISDVIGEETTKKFQIELENTEELKAQLYTLKKEIDKLFETSKMNKWETQYLNAIKNIETAFEGLFGVKESNEMELVSYLAKDIAMTDKAMKKEGRKIGPEDMYDIYNILWDAGVIKENSREAFEKAIEKGKLFSSLEHGGYLTKDFKVGGLTSVDSNDSTGFTNINIDWEKYGAKIVEGILSSIHSHAGDKIWMPSISADLKLASKEYAKNIPYFTTFTGTEVAVIDTEKLAKITANLKDWENLEKLVDKGAYGMAKGDKSVVGQEVYDSYVAERTKYTSKIGRMDYRTSKLIAERVLLDALLKERYGAGLDSFSKIYTLDEYAKAHPYGDYHKEEQLTGLSGIITTLQNVVQSATTLTQSLVNYGENQAQTKAVVDPATLTESIINALNTATVNINVDSLADIIQNAIASSAIKVDTKNGNATSVDLTALTTALTTALAQNSVKFDANELASAIKGSLDFSPVVESINSLPLNAIQDSLQQLIEITQSVIVANQSPSTIQDQIKQLENAIQQDIEKINILRGNEHINPSVHRSRRPDFFGDDDDSKNANDIQRQIEQLEKDRQQKIERLNYLKSLLQSKTTDTQINLADNFNFDSVDSNKLNELIQFLKTYVNLINKLANDKTMTRVTDNINSLTQAISKFGGSKRKENPVLAQLESLMAKGQELQVLADILKKSTAEIQEAVNVVQNTGKDKRNKPLGLGHVEVNSKEWDRLIEKAKKFGITLENVDEIIRHVDDQGNESFRFIDKLGNIKTFGINSKEFKFIEEYVVKVKASIDTIKREASSLPGIFQRAFRGDANASTNITNTLEHISTLFAEISKYPDELTGSKSDLLGYISNTMTSAMREVDKLLTGSQKGKSPEFQKNLEAVVESLKEIKTLIDSGEFQEAANLLNGTTQNFFNLGAESGGQSVKNATAINKLLGNIEQLRSTYMSMSHSAKQALQDLSRDIIQTAEQFDNAIPEAKMREFNERFLEIRTNALKSLRTIGSHFKRSALQLARMYLSWYRIISYIRQGVQEVIEMDTALTKMSYTMNVTEEQLKSMSADMISMAKNLATSVNNIEQIYQIYANLKTTQEELEKTARPTAILSNLSSVDASTAADQIQGVLNQFELVADDTMHIVDVYDKISANIKVDYSKGIAGMADAVQQVGNFANQAGLSFEQLAAIVGRVMQQTRQEGGQIGTALKTIMTRISKSSNLADPEEVDNATLDKASKALHRIGVEVYTTSGEFREFDTIMTELSERWDSLSDAEQSNISFAIAATRQTATLRAVLQNWAEAMNLATEATDADGNALAHQQQYVESLAGHMQSLKTEMSALWMELLDSDTIKTFIDSIKELIVSLEDGVTGLKPIVDFLANILSIVTKILSIIPPGGLIASAIGLKYGTAITKFFRNIIYDLTSTASMFGTATAAATAFDKVLLTIKANKFGLITIAITGIITLFNALYTSTEELEQKFNELSQKIEASETKIKSLNEELKSQKKIIDDINSNPLDAVSTQQLQNAIDLTAQLERQLELEKLKKREISDESIETKMDLWWREDYLFNRKSIKNKGDDRPTKISSEEYIKTLSEDEIKKYTVNINSELESAKFLYDELLETEEWFLTESEKDFMDYYEQMEQMRDKLFRIFNPDVWNRTEVTSILGKKNIQEELNGISEGLDKWASKNKYLIEHGYFSPIDEIINQIKSGDYPEVMDAINEAVFSENLNDDQKIEVFAKEYFKKIKDKFAKVSKSGEQYQSIDLSSWLKQTSDVESDKTWDDILDSYESGLNSLGDLLKKWKSGNEVITTKDIFDVTDVKDSIFQKLGMGSFDSYLKDAGNDIGRALFTYIQDTFTALTENINNPELIEGFDVVIEKLQTLMKVASGGADNVNKLDNSYKELISVYEKIKSGKKLTTEETAELINKYGALQDAVKGTTDSYSFEEKALVNLINQYIELSNEAIAADIRRAEQAIETAQIVLTSIRVEATTVQRAYDLYNQMVNSGTSKEKAAWSVSKIFGIDELGDLIKGEEELKQLKELFEETVKNGNKYDIIANGTEIDWIANSLENLANKVDEVQSSYDRLLTTFGSKKALKTANADLKAINKELETQRDGFKKAAESYQKEFDSLKLSKESIELIKNFALTGKGWDIKKYDSETAEKLNKGLDLYKKIQENIKSEAETTQKILTNQIQQMQNLADYYDARIATKEAKLNITTSAKTQQKIITNLISLYREQYAAQIAIAEANGEELKIKQLIYEEEAKIEELEVQRAQAPIEAITKKYERIASEFENRQAVLEHNINMTEAKGYMSNVNYYKTLIDNEMDTINSNLKERNKLIEQLSTIDPDSEGMLDLWWETKEQIDSVTASLYESEEAITEWQNAIDNIKYDVFQRIQDIISGINDESKFLAGLFDDNKLFKYVKEIWGKENRPTKVYYGGFSDEGLAMLGLHQLQIKTNIELAENYAEELADINKQLKKDPANTQLLDKRNELLSLQREQIEATESEKDAIIDLIREGYDKQLDSLQTLIDKYVEALESSKSLYDYEKSIANKTKDIAKTRKMLAAYATDTSEEARSRMQQLTVQLKESEEDLRSAQWDHYLSEQRDILDEMYESFEQYIDDKMENRDALLEDVATMVDNNFNEISKTLSNKADSVGTSLTNSMKNMWSTPISQISSIQEKIATSDTNISAIENSINSVLPGLKTYLENYNKDPDEIINGQDKPLSKIQKKIDKLDTAIDIEGRLKVNNDNVVAELGRVIEAIEGLNIKNSGAIAKSVADIVNYNPTQTLAPNSQVSNNIQGSEKNNAKGFTSNGSANFFVYQKYAGDKSKLKKETSIVDRLLYNDIYIGRNPSDLTQRAVYYAGMGFTDKYVGSTIQNQMMIDWMRKHNYAKGARRISKNELAWTQENGVEAIIRPTDGAILTPLAKNDAVLNNVATQNIWDMANNPLQFIKDNLSVPNLHSNINSGNYDIQQSLMITLPSVKNYSEFVTALQNDKKFEQMIQDMTINQLNGKNSLAKYKYKY